MDSDKAGHVAERETGPLPKVLPLATLSEAAAQEEESDVRQGDGNHAAKISVSFATLTK